MSGQPEAEDDYVDEPTELAPLKVKCTDAKCEDDLHCFKATKQMLADDEAGACRECGIQLVDWARVHARDLADIDHTFGELRRELIRHHFFHLDFDERARNHALRKGRLQLHEAAHRRLVTSVVRAGSAWDGQQTPFTGNTIYYAQHATASCCRKCIEYWHAIPSDRDLTAEETAYLHGLVVRFLDERLADLPDEPQRVPRRRS
jgi:hypothetical protein